ncbi:hypothetical protein LTS18_010734, partial [Coniosporium uncinatum]
RRFDSFDSQLGLLSSVNADWAAFCARLRGKWPASNTKHLDLPTEDFDLILEGIVDAYGAAEGRRLWDLWVAPIRPEDKVGVGGVRKMDPVRPSRGQGYDFRNVSVTLKDVPGGPLVFLGKVRPALSTLRVLVRAAVRERDDPALVNGGAGEVVEWVKGRMRELGLGEEDVGFECGERTRGLL